MAEPKPLEKADFIADLGKAMDGLRNAGGSLLYSPGGERNQTNWTATPGNEGPGTFQPHFVLGGYLWGGGNKGDALMRGIVSRIKDAIDQAARCQAMKKDPLQSRADRAKLTCKPIISIDGELVTVNWVK
jgi:hypothetical protein